MVKVVVVELRVLYDVAVERAAEQILQHTGPHGSQCQPLRDTGTPTTLDIFKFMYVCSQDSTHSCSYMYKNKNKRLTASEVHAEKRYVFV